MNKVSRGHEKFLTSERAKTTGLRVVHLRAFPREFSWERQFFLHDFEACWLVSRSTGSRKRKSLMFVVSPRQDANRKLCRRIGSSAFAINSFSYFHDQLVLLQKVRSFLHEISIIKWFELLARFLLIIG